MGADELAMLRVTAAAWAIAIICVALALSGWTHWGAILLLVIPGLAAWAVRRASLLVTFYLTQMAVYFGLTSLVLVEDRPPILIGIVAIWAVGLTIGGFAGRTNIPAPHVTEWSRPRWPQFVLIAGLVTMQAGLVLSGRLGFGAQLTLGLSTPTGVLGILAAAAPVLSLMLLITASRSQHLVYVAAVLAGLEAVVLSLSGFRAGAAVFVVGAVIAAALTLPQDSPWRRKYRAIIFATVLTIVVVVGFIVGANVRSGVATELGASSQGTQLFSLDQALPIIASRLDLGAPLQTAIQYQDDPSLKGAVSWTSQIQAFIPRFLWPDKPIIDYGQQVSATAYGLQYGQSSSTISTVGDTLVNFKIPGLVIVSLGLGLALSLAERRIRTGAGLQSLVLAAGLSYAVVGQEAPLILTVAGVVRNLLVAAILWAASQAVYRVVRRHLVP